MKKTGKGFIREVRLRRERVESFDQYPFAIPAIRSLEKLTLDPHITFFIGENGCGKSTLIEAIAIRAGFNPEGGTKNLRFSAKPTESPLHEAIELVREFRREKTGFFLRAETMFNVATEAERLELSAYGWIDMHTRSHGESLLWLVRERFHGNGLYVLDEPEAALSPQRQLAMLKLIHELISAGSQFIIATHSPILMSYPEALIYALDESGLGPVAYEDTEHYTIMRTFMLDPARMIHRLLNEE